MCAVWIRAKSCESWPLQEKLHHPGHPVFLKTVMDSWTGLAAKPRMWMMMMMMMMMVVMVVVVMAVVAALPCSSHISHLHGNVLQCP